ncbi:La-related protein 1C [Raphanus sativus]|uniref:La-related protein 1C n=1 Tax=Raphanus sativus TaxID=3726 RepID=A0A6J0KMN5_RAPSA|nr:la-related protein 1C [Raphanus sativus]XP_056853170.1 la-related protein 1C-like [Raphanus sativus]KAJ4871795.1 La-related protein 1C [Raphanus sativus]KAJ4874105.1 La-related protein 1C [Raphanus sativus]
MASAATNNSTSSSSISPRHVTDSPRHVSENRGSPTATQPRRPSRQVSSPWTQIVRGESEPPTIAAAAAAPPSKAPIDQIASAPVAAPPAPPLLTAEESGDQGESTGKKPVWNRPSNGASEIAPVMGASSWPALSETTKAPPSNKSSSDSSIGDVPSSSVSQGAASASVPAPKQLGRANNPNPTPNHSARQRSFKRNGASANGTVPQPTAQGSLVEGASSHNPSPRGQSQKNNGFAASQTHGGGTTDNQRDSHRNQNGNHHHHHHQNHGGRRNQEHGNQNWNFHRSFNGRDGNNAQSQRGAPAFVRYAPPPPPPPPVQAIPPQFMAAQSIQSFGSPVPFPPELAPPFYPGGMPFVAPLSPGPVFYHVQDPPLSIKLQNQIHYYFSEENLIKDTYLREQMDDQGFAPLYVIAGFRKVAELTDSIQQIVEALQGSPFVEVQGDRIRKRHYWQHWLIPKETNPAVPNPQPVDAVASRVGNLSIGQSSAEPIGGSGSQLQPAEAENKAVSDGQPESSGVDPVSNSNGSGGANR